jgi:hypothetical protein
MEFEEAEIIEEPDPETVRKLPWLIDVFCYPVSVPGMVILGIYVFTPIILSLTISAISVVLGPLSILLMPLGLVFLIIKITISAYMFWYFGMCIRQSASGQVRAPETLNTGMQDDFAEMAMELLRIVCCVAVCLGPGLIYYSYTKRMDQILWLLLGCGVFFLPMALLAMVMFGSFSGLNPIIIVPSIFSTFLGYCLVVLALCVPVAIAVGILVCLTKGSGTVVTFIMRGVFAYFALVAAHILGRFYYRNAERLCWEV